MNGKMNLKNYELVYGFRAGQIAIQMPNSKKLQCMRIYARVHKNMKLQAHIHLYTMEEVKDSIFLDIDLKQKNIREIYAISCPSPPRLSAHPLKT